ncbi:RluA family pseudouridine synthase [Bacillus sp. RG28]|uniref:Pseudouridine synthase n=1 Tax=Gottfriedia endophytica TaxID=2820819 RepID=A0A940SIL7_9BACI|nr:RluA family pseudouridine synthase [Gottfriedia endophytica]MBP0724606.1 RluA family pseudouridine synthase [Gottfriedia endophytica]
MKPYTIQWTVSEADSGILLRDFLKRNDISKKALTDIKFKGGLILVNGEEKTVRTVLNTNDIVKVQFPSEIFSEDLVVEYIPFDIVYEDDFVLVINKPFGIPSIPSREHPKGTIANGLLYYFFQIGLQSTVHIVTRLDKDTSGLMLIAKNRFVHHLFSKNGLEHIQRKYLAFVHGQLEDSSGIIDAPIGRKDDSLIEREVRQDGQKAVTHFEVISFNEKYSFLRLQLETGRTHQIRVHLSFIGHSLVGDDLYGGSVETLKRQSLHSYAIQFYHPFHQKNYLFEIGLPSDLAEWKSIHMPE